MKKLLLFLLILSMFMVSCGGNSKNEAIEKGIKDAEASQEDAPELKDDEESSHEDNENEEEADEDENKDDLDEDNGKADIKPEDVNPAGYYKAIIDGKKYGNVESLDGNIFTVERLNQLLAKAWKEGKYADDKALDFVTDYIHFADDEVMYGVNPGSMEFLLTYNDTYKVSYYTDGDEEGIDKIYYKKHDPEDAEIYGRDLFIDIKFLSTVFSFNYDIDVVNKVLTIDTNGDNKVDLTELDPSGYDSVDALLKANFGK